MQITLTLKTLGLRPRFLNVYLTHISIFNFVLTKHSATININLVIRYKY